MLTLLSQPDLRRYLRYKNLKRCVHPDSVMPYRIIFIWHLHARLAAEVRSTHDWLTIRCHLVFYGIYMWHVDDTLWVDELDFSHWCVRYNGFVLFPFRQLFSSIILILSDWINAILSRSKLCVSVHPHELIIRLILMQSTFLCTDCCFECC